LSGSNIGGKPATKGNHGDYCSYFKRSRHTKEICFKLHGRNKLVERIGSNKGTSQKWAGNTISKHQDTNQPSAPPQLDLDMKASKEELDR